MKAVVDVQAGICGFKTRIRADAADGQMVTFDVTTDCAKIEALSKALAAKEIDAYSEIGAGFDGVIHTAIRSSLQGCCSGCATAISFWKAMQVAAQLALPKDVSITMCVEKDES